jgi:2-polyprenyl-6-methoxyphenol hydroxylase-like FAD-dependent oxidoreductase
MDFKKGNERNDSLVFIREFDVIVGCDGAKSSVRETAGIEWQRQSEFQVIKNVISNENETNVKRISTLHQTALLLNFKTINGECPYLKKGQYE